MSGTRALSRALEAIKRWQLAMGKSSGLAHHVSSVAPVPAGLPRHQSGNQHLAAFIGLWKVFVG